MTQNTLPKWLSMQTEETRDVEKVLRSVFPLSDAYRYNSASIRVRIVDERFKGLSHAKRDDLVEPLIRQLPRATQRDIMNLMLFAPDDFEESVSARLANLEFEEPAPSSL